MWIKVDPANRNAWRVEPYYSVLKRWSADFIEAGGYILVDEGLQAVCITPAEEVVVSRNRRPVAFHIRTSKVGLTVTHEVVLEHS